MAQSDLGLGQTVQPAQPQQGIGGAISGAIQNAQRIANPQSQSPPTVLPNRPSYTQPGGSSTTTGPTPEQILQTSLSWTSPIAQQYIGRDLSYRELLEVQKQGMNPESLRQHFRGMPSYIPGLTMGQLEDYHTNSKPAFDSWLGRQATDEDIKDLHNRGIQDPQAIDEYIRNRPDVVALHPGSPLNMQDLQYHQAKNDIDNSYLQNLGRMSTDEEARTGITDKTKGPKPVEDTELRPEYSQGAQGLESKTMIAPNARSFA